MSVSLKKTFIATSILVSSLIFAAPALAAAPDGLGPWADNVVSSAQGLRNDGSAVLPLRSDPSSALGVAEQNNVEGTFYSLGFGGSLTLGFDNGISGGSMVFESTNLPYPIETAKVEFSSNGTTWVNAGSVSRTGTVRQPANVACAKFVRITDTSNKSLYEPTADGYDVDGVKATGKSCNPTPPHCDNNRDNHNRDDHDASGSANMHNNRDHEDHNYGQNNSNNRTNNDNQGNRNHR